MAITQNTYTGNGSTVLYSFTFPYLETTDIKVSLNGTVTTSYTLANATTIQFNTAPANGAAIRIYRETDDSQLAAQFYAGSAIRSQDLNDNFTQNLYVTQEANREATSAVTSANSSISTANTALSTAQAAQASATAAVSTANAASSSAASAVSTANAASSAAAGAVSTANTANTNASNALSAVSSALLYTPVNNVAAIPGSPTNGQAVRVLDSTGIESFTPLSGLPVGFVGNSALSVEIYYQSSTSSWVWSRYFPTDPENRYLKLTGGTLTGQLKADDSTSTANPVYSFDGDVNTGLAHPGADELALVTGGTVRITIDPAGNTTFANPVTIPAGSTVTGYLDTATASSTYLTQANASSTYLTQSNASSTYLTQANASSTYQTQAGMSGYLATGAIGTTVQAYDANTAKTNVAQSYSAAQRGTHVTLTDGATITPDFAAGNHFTVTLGGNRTLANPTNLTAGQSGVIYIVQDGTGSRTLAYGSNWDFAGGTAPTLSTAANAIDVLCYAVRSNSSIAATLIKDVK